MKIVVAPDSFKECLSSVAVAGVLVDAVREAVPNAEVLEIPLSDGGEGSLEVWLRATGGTRREAVVSNPLGRPVRASYGVLGETCFLETALACGLSLLSPVERNPLRTDTRGVGELLLAARCDGCSHFLVALGGSATCDGGAGMCAVPGLREAMRGATVEVLCDVDTPFVGPKGAARVFGPQKGASPADVEILEMRLQERAAQIFRETGVAVADLPGAGAAGGLGGAFRACFNARLVPGIDRILDLAGFDEAASGADLIITGEGSSDAQTLLGKVPMGVLRRSNGVPVALLSGRIQDAESLSQAGFGPMIPVTPEGMPLEEALRPDTARKNLRTAVQRLFSMMIT